MATAGPVIRIGRRIGGPFETVWDQFRFYGQVLRNLPTAFKYGNVILRLITDVTVGAGALILGGGMFFVIASLAFFTGAVVGFEGYVGLEQIGAQAYVGLVSSWANTREITPLIAGVALAAQVGAGYTAELGAMRISEEIDALEVMSVPSVVYLVSTRVWAALIPIVPLYLMALFSSYYATRMTVTGYFGLSTGSYGQYFNLFLPATDVLYSVTKVIVFAVVVVLIHCYYGYYASGGPAGVGVAVGRAIRTSIVAVVVLNLLLSILMWGGGDTVRIAG
jgi:phospholipid/cholesterol/gamma-HCH transport system permease protein